jgi:hypothetical protein
LLYYYEIRRINAGRAMPLLAFWESNPEEVGKSSIEQIVAMAGDGNLKDGSSCSDELRKYLAEAESAKLGARPDRHRGRAFVAR